MEDYVGVLRISPNETHADARCLRTVVEPEPPQTPPIAPPPPPPPPLPPSTPAPQSPSSSHLGLVDGLLVGSLLAAGTVLLACIAVCLLYRHLAKRAAHLRLSRDRAQMDLSLLAHQVGAQSSAPDDANSSAQRTDSIALSGVVPPSLPPAPPSTTAGDASTVADGEGGVAESTAHRIEVRQGTVPAPCDDQVCDGQGCNSNTGLERDSASGQWYCATCWAELRQDCAEPGAERAMPTSDADSGGSAPNDSDSGTTSTTAPWASATWSWAAKTTAGPSEAATSRMSVEVAEQELTSMGDDDLAEVLVDTELLKVIERANASGPGGAEPPAPDDDTAGVAESWKDALIQLSQEVAESAAAPLPSKQKRRRADTSAAGPSADSSKSSSAGAATKEPANTRPRHHPRGGKPLPNPHGGKPHPEPPAASTSVMAHEEEQQEELMARPAATPALACEVATAHEALGASRPRVAPEMVPQMAGAMVAQLQQPQPQPQPQPQQQEQQQQHMLHQQEQQQQQMLHQQRMSQQKQQLLAQGQLLQAQMMLQPQGQMMLQPEEQNQRLLQMHLEHVLQDRERQAQQLLHAQAVQKQQRTDQLLRLQQHAQQQHQLAQKLSAAASATPTTLPPPLMTPSTAHQLPAAHLVPPSEQQQQQQQLTLFQRLFSSSARTGKQPGQKPLSDEL